MAKSPKKEQFYTPVAPFKYAHVNKPDYGTDDYPKPEGELSVTLAFDKDSADYKNFMKQMEPHIAEQRRVAEEGFASAPPKTKAVYKQKNITGPAVMPFCSEEYDADGDPTGRVLLKVKTKATFTNKEGEVVKKVVPMVDGLGEIIPFKKRPLVYAGTTGRVAFVLGFSYIPATAETYMSAYLNQVQIAKLATAGGGASAFGAIEGSGFSADDLDEYDPDGDNSTGGGDVDDSDDIDDEIPF